MGLLLTSLRRGRLGVSRAGCWPPWALSPRPRDPFHFCRAAVLGAGEHSSLAAFLSESDKRFKAQGHHYLFFIPAGYCEV